MVAKSGPLAGLRVLDLGTRIAAPFCAGLLGELGADVIKIEEPGRGDFMRSIGPFEDGYSLFWAVEGRGRRSATLDLRIAEGQDALRRLAMTADVLVENFRPGTLEKWHLGPDEMPANMVIVRISQYGQDGPLMDRPGLDRLGIAFGGLLHITGFPDQPPVRPGVTISDYLTGTFAAMSALAVLRHRDSTGIGGVVDASLYGSIMRIMEWTFAAYDHLGTVRERSGNRVSNSAPVDNFLAADGRFVCIVGGSDANFMRLMSAMGRPDLSLDPRFATLEQRALHGEVINQIVADWCGKLSSSEVEKRCVAEGVPVATVSTVADIVNDPHVAYRSDLIHVIDPVIGKVLQQAPYPKVSVMDRSRVPDGAPLLGQHNDEVWLSVLSSDEYQQLRIKGVI